jgi:hypothetical protein
MRMWPHTAAFFVEHYEDLPLVHPAIPKRNVPVGRGGFGTFCDSPRPIACLYVPDRQEQGGGNAQISIEPLSGREAVLELVRYSFLPRILAAVGLEGQHLKAMAQVAQRVPVRRLCYPSGLEHLSCIRDRILEDLVGLS